MCCWSKGSLCVPQAILTRTSIVGQRMERARLEIQFKMPVIAHHADSEPREPVLGVVPLPKEMRL